MLYRPQRGVDDCVYMQAWTFTASNDHTIQRRRRISTATRLVQNALYEEGDLSDDYVPHNGATDQN
jgi:hypothetical protein